MRAPAVERGSSPRLSPSAADLRMGDRKRSQQWASFAWDPFRSSRVGYAMADDPQPQISLGGCDPVAIIHALLNFLDQF